MSYRIPSSFLRKGCSLHPTPLFSKTSTARKYRPCFRAGLISSKSENIKWYCGPTLSKRSYATASSSEAPSEEPPINVSWPTVQHPTPYEIFHISQGTKIDKKFIKKTFHKFAKIYHPDATLASDGLHDSLTPELKEDRFKKIVAAYDILKDDAKRRDFDLFNKGWEDSPRSRSKNVYGRDFSRATRYKTNITYEDDSWAAFHNDYRQHMQQQDPAYQKSQWEAHKKMVLYLLIGSLAVGAIQFSFLMNHATNAVEVRKETSRKTFHDLSLALTNYGFGFSKEERINRFLAHRETSEMYDNSWERQDNLCTSSFLSVSNDRYARSTAREKQNKEASSTSSSPTSDSISDSTPVIANNSTTADSSIIPSSANTIPSATPHSTSA
ncbi:uncharacterized protein SAPINGB_P005445 [Magnusiomyces paraingens]|uniref:J domain-containing protein n=1 Tax=Magnusiomyces paraingens TaxID=2606893 RepID=A0A5E8C531_9ASCO|nr:uncharacterized protein SAPINGB_P005445 [Saprochaete ingens]VVT56958.1 unnamed protein product [Saprochaete ingens]